MTAELDPPMSGGRARRARRAVITDDSYGEEGYLERDTVAEAPAPQRAPTPSIAKARGAAPSRGREVKLPATVRPKSAGHGVVWRLAALATFMWLGGVLSFAAGYFQLPIEPIALLPQAAMQLPPHLLMMTGAVAIAPLGLIWLTALAARRSAALKELISDMGGAKTGGGDGASLREETEAAARSIGALEASFEAVEERAQLARDRLQTEREAVMRLIEEIEGGSSRLAGALSDIREKAGGSAPRARQTAGGSRSGGERSAGERTVGLEPASMLAGAPRPTPSAAGSNVDDDEFDEENEEFTPALGPERSAPSSPAARVKVGDPPPLGGGNGRARQQLDEINRLKARVEGGGRAGAAPGPARSAASGSLDWVKLIAAANFPESEDDQETLDALYAVLTDSETAALLQAAEDALSGLADIGLFMEDMQPHHAPAELWRSYIVDGKKTDALDLGGIRDPHAIEDTTEALRSKQDFAKIAERFLDRYETMVERLFSEAPQQTMVVELADTRSGRAYMLLARASGRFG